MPYEIIELTPEQKEVALANCDKLDHQSLTRLVFKDTTLDGRSTEGKSLKVFLSGLGKTLTPARYSKMEELILTDDQKKLIETMASKVESSLELARLVWADETVKNQSAQWRVVYKYFKTVLPEGIKTTEEPVEEMEYSPPVTKQSLVTVANEALPTGKADKKIYNWGKLKGAEDRCLDALLGYMHIFRFRYQASQYEKQVDRNLFITTFVRWAHDKPDLTQIEQDQMMSAAAETVNIAQIDRAIQRIDKWQEEIMSNGGWIEETTSSGEIRKRKLSMTDVDLISNMRTKFDTAKKQLQDLMTKLESSRSKRLGEKDERNSTILNLFDAWQKDEEKRTDLIEQGKKEHEEDAREVGRLKELDDITALIAGMSREEAEGGM